MKSSVALEQIEDQAVAVDLGTGSCYKLNDVGAFVLGHVDGTKSVAAITERVVAHFEIERETARGHVEDFLEGLSSEGLVSFI